MTVLQTRCRGCAVVRGRWLRRMSWSMVLAAPVMVCQQRPEANTKQNANDCYVHEVKTLPGSHAYAADFVEVMATDPSLRASDRAKYGNRDRNVLWGLNADLSSEVPAEERALYISKSTDGGETWTVVAGLGSEYFDAGIDEGLRNGLSVAPGGGEFVVTTQKGAFQVIPRGSDAVVKYITGPRVPHDGRG